MHIHDKECSQGQITECQGDHTSNVELETLRPLKKEVMRRHTFLREVLLVTSKKWASRSLMTDL